MKKIMLAALMVLLSVTAGAQTLAGNWTLNKEFGNMLNEVIEAEKMKMEFGMNFTESEVKIVIDAIVGEEAVNMTVQIVIPGTYVKNGDKVTCDFNKEKADFDIVDIQSDDEEMKEMLSQPATKKMMLAMIKGEAKKQMGSTVDAFGSLADQFKEFTVTKLTETKLEIEHTGQPLVFDKKQ